MCVITAGVVPTTFYVAYKSLSCVSKLLSSKLGVKEKSILWLRTMFPSQQNYKSRTSTSRAAKMTVAVLLFVLAFVYFIYGMHMTMAHTTVLSMAAKSGYAKSQIEELVTPARQILKLLNNTHYLGEETFHDYMEPDSGGEMANHYIRMDKYLTAMVTEFPEVNYIFFGTTQNRFAGAKYDNDGNLLVGAQDTYTQGTAPEAPFYYYNVTSEGVRDQIVDISDNENVPDMLDIPSSAWYAQGASVGGMGWVDAYSQDGNRLKLTAYMPFYDENHVLAGVFGVDLHLSNISSVLAESLPNAADTRSFIVDADGNLLGAGSYNEPYTVDEPSQSRSCLMGNSVPEDTTGSIKAESTTLMGYEAFTDFHTAQNYTSLYSDPLVTTLNVAYYEALNWTIVTVIPQSVFYEDLQTLTNYTFIIAIMMWFTVGFIVDLLLARLRKIVNDDSSVYKQLARIRCRYMINTLALHSAARVIKGLNLSSSAWGENYTRDDMPKAVAMTLQLLWEWRQNYRLGKEYKYLVAHGRIAIKTVVDPAIASRNAQKNKPGHRVYKNKPNKRDKSVGVGVGLSGEAIELQDIASTSPKLSRQPTNALAAHTSAATIGNTASVAKLHEDREAREAAEKNPFDQTSTLDSHAKLGRRGSVADKVKGLGLQGPGSSTSEDGPGSGTGTGVAG